MNESRKLNEIRKLLAFIYFEWQKPITKELIGYWGSMLQGITPESAWKAARKLAETKTFGEPKFQDFAECLKEITVKPRKYNPWCEAKPTREITRHVMKNIAPKQIN